MDIRNAMLQLISMHSVSDDTEGYTCQYCGAFVKAKEVSIFGRKTKVQPRCQCELRRYERDIEEMRKAEENDRIERIFGFGRLGVRFANSTFDRFQMRPGLEKPFAFAKDFAKNFASYAGTSLMFWGPPGSGKTFLAAAITHELVKQGKIVIFQTMTDLLARIRSTFDSNKTTETEAEIMYAIQKCDLLVLDDLGTEKMSDWVQDVLFRIVDGRYRAAKPIMITSNLSPSILKSAIGDKITDRLLEICLPVHVDAPSYRLEQAKKRLEQMVGDNHV